MARYATKPEKEDKERKVTFISKDEIACPVCGTKFHREELFSGRVNAGELTDELHRTYIPMQAYGEVHPLVYDLTVCPGCWYSAFKGDFSGIPQKVVDQLSESTSARVQAAESMFDAVDYSSPRRLVEGAASYYLALQSYQFFGKDYAPAIKQGICALRCAWLCGYLEAKSPGDNYDYAARVLYGRARFFYRLAMELEQKGKENLTGVKWLGPDTDKNYGYEGVLFVATTLELKYGPRSDDARRSELITEAKRTVAKMFGLGKKTRSKPGPLVDKVRDLYDLLKAELHQGDEEDDE